MRLIHRITRQSNKAKLPNGWDKAIALAFQGLSPVWEFYHKQDPSCSFSIMEGTLCDDSHKHLGQPIMSNCQVSNIFVRKLGLHRGQ